MDKATHYKVSDFSNVFSSLSLSVILCLVRAALAMSTHEIFAYCHRQADCMLPLNVPFAIKIFINSSKDGKLN